MSWFTDLYPMTPLSLLGLMAAAFAAGVVDSIGGGGGLITVPAYLAVGVSPFWVLGTNKAMAFTGAVVSTLRYKKAGFMPSYPRAEWTRLIGFCIFASSMGAAVSTLPTVVNSVKAWVAPVLMFVMAFLIKRWVIDEIHHKFKKTERAVRDPKHPDWKTRAAVAGIAGYDGIFGPGAGSFYLTYLEKHGYRTVTANALTKVLNLSSNVGALTLFALSGRVLWATGLTAAVAFMGGNFVGSGLVIKKGQTWVRVFVLTTTTLLLIKFLRQP